MKKLLLNLTRVLALLVLVLTFSLTFREKALAADSYWAFVRLRASDGATREVRKSSVKQYIYIEDGQEHSINDQHIGYSNKYTKLTDHSLELTLDEKTKTYTCRVISGSMESSDKIPDSLFLDGLFYAYYPDGTKVSFDDVWTAAVSIDHMGYFFWVQGNVIETPTVKISSPDITVPYALGRSYVNLPEGAKIESSTYDGVNINDIYPYADISPDDIGKGYITKEIQCDKGVKVKDSYVKVMVTGEDLTRTTLFNVIPENAEYPYTGSEICPLVGDVCIKLFNNSEIHLEEGVDYDITYEDNILPTSKAKIILTFKGRYTGTKTYNFRICRVALTEEDVTIPVEDFVEGEGYVNPVSLFPTFSDSFQSLREKDPNNGNISVKLSTKDEEGNDKSLLEASTPGEYLCTVTIDNGTYYKGITVSKKFKILAKPAPAPDPTPDPTPAPSNPDPAPNTQEVVTQPDTNATTNTTTNNTTTNSTKTKKKKTATSVTTPEAETVATEEVSVSENEATVAEVTEEVAVIEEAVAVEETPAIEEAVKEETTVEEAVTEEKDETVIADEDVALVNAPANSKLPLPIILLIVLGSLIAFSGIGFGIYKYLGKSVNN